MPVLQRKYGISKPAGYQRVVWSILAGAPAETSISCTSDLTHTIRHYTLSATRAPITS